MSVRQVLVARKRAATMSKEAMYNVVRSPLVITEKATLVNERGNQVVFKVSRSTATKPEIKAAVEGLFGVKVLGRQHAHPKGQDQAVPRPPRRPFRHQEGLCAASRGTVHRHVHRLELI